MDLKKTGIFIRMERKRLNLSQKQLGERLSVTDKAVSKWERGLAFPDVDVLNSLAQLFHCSVQNILDGDFRSSGETDHVRFSQNAFLPPAADGKSGTEDNADPVTRPKSRSQIECLVLSDGESDLTDVLAGCGVKLTRMKLEDGVNTDLSAFDSYVIIADGKVLDPCLRVRLENENAKGKRIFTEALNSWDGIYSAAPANTTRSRLVVAVSGESGIPGLEPGDLLDDQSNRMMQPWYAVPGMKVLLAYRDHVIAHRHWDATPDEILSNSRPGLWTIGDNVMMCSFELRNFNRARFSPRRSWQQLRCHR